MTALNDSERAVQNWTSARPDRPAPVRTTPPAETASKPPAESAAPRISRYYPAWLPSRRFIAAVVAIGGMQLLATMDSTVAIVALPKIQNELSLSDAGRSWVITAYVLTFGGLMLLFHHGREIPSYSTFRGEPEAIRTLSGIVHGAAGLDARSIIQLGLVLLIATPILRVAFTWVAFALQRDRMYVLITSIVLAVLLYGLIYGKA